MLIQIGIQKLREDKELSLPRKADQGCSGFDLFSLETVTLEPGSRHLFKMGYALEIPSGWEVQVRSRSGLALKHGVIVLNSPGTIDSSYTGELGVLLFNTEKTPYTVEEGDRIAQMVVSQVHKVLFNEIQMLKQTERGDKGFGSSGR